jgi:type I restriction enzyme S subunit
MSEWKKVKLGEICDISAGGDRPLLVSEKKTNICQVPIYSNGIDNQGLYGYTDIEKIKGGTITITGRGANAGTVFYRKTAYYPIIRLLSLVPNKEVIDSQYLYYLIKDRTFLSTGSAQPQITVPNISDYVICYNTNLAIQDRIANILSRYDSLIENYQKQIKLLDEAAQRLYKEWFVDLRFPGHENTKIVDGVPEGWEKKRIGDIVEYFDKQRKPLSSMQRMSMDKVYPYYGAATLMDYVDNYLFDGIYLLLGEDGTVITPDNYPVLQYVWGKFWVNNHAHVLRGKNNISTEFLYAMFKEMPIADVVTGAAQPKISQGRLSEKKVLMPPKELILKWSNITKSYFDSYRNLSDKIRLLTEARDRLLPKLMSGEIAV